MSRNQMAPAVAEVIADVIQIWIRNRAPVLILKRFADAVQNVTVRAD